MTDRLWEFLPIDVKFVGAQISKGRLGSPPETFNSSEAWGKCSSRLVVCGLTEPVCSPTPGLEPPSVDRSAAFIYTGPVLLFTDHHFYWSSSSITRVQGSTWIRHYRKCWASSYIYKYPCSLLVLHYLWHFEYYSAPVVPLWTVFTFWCPGFAWVK